MPILLIVVLITAFLSSRLLGKTSFATGAIIAALALITAWFFSGNFITNNGVPPGTQNTPAM